MQRHMGRTLSGSAAMVSTAAPPDPPPDARAFAIAIARARAAHRLSAPEAANAASEAIARFRAPGASDAINHWRDMKDRTEACRAALAEAQQRVRVLARVEEDEEGREALDEAILRRDEARSSLITALTEALSLHRERHGEEQWRRKKEEEEALLGKGGSLALHERVRLETLQSSLLPTLEEWMGFIGVQVGMKRVFWA